MIGPGAGRRGAGSEPIGRKLEPSLRAVLKSPSGASLSCRVWCCGSPPRPPAPRGDLRRPGRLPGPPRSPSAAHYIVNPWSFAHWPATTSGSCLSLSTFLSSWARSAVVSAADTLFSRSLMALVRRLSG